MILNGRVYYTLSPLKRMKELVDERLTDYRGGENAEGLCDDAYEAW